MQIPACDQFRICYALRTIKVTNGAAGQPVVIRWASGTQDATLIGLDPIFRGHPEDSFRLVANTIYSALD
jgi:hypothetical protein